MSRIRSSILGVAALAAGVFALPLDAQERDRRIVSSEISISRDNAELDLEFDNGGEVEYAIRNGRVYVGGENVGAAEPGSELDRSWRDLLNSSMTVPTDRLAGVLAEWQAPEGDAAARMDAALEALAASVPAASAAVDDDLAGAARGLSAADRARLEELRARNAELEARLERLAERQERDGWDIGDPIRHVWRQFIGILQTLASYVIIVALGFAAVFFGRKYLEGIADTARAAPLRSWAVGFAATFLAVPVFVLGVLALAVSIIGIPVLLVWIPLFPVVLGLALVFGYLAVAHAAGESLAEWRFRGGDWFKLGNSYYYMVTGVGLLMVLFIVHNLLRMVAIPVLPAMVAVLEVFVTWAALSIGFGAVLLSRFGTRPYTGAVPTAAEPEPDFEEEVSGV